MEHEIFDGGDITLQSGQMLRRARLAYKTYGTLNARKDNAILYPTWFAGRHEDNEWLIGPGRALDPEHYFVIVPNLLGNGLSSSPSNTPGPFPNVTVTDNVHFQHRLVRERFGIDRLALVVGWSLGAMQAFHWGALYPAMVERLAPFCGSARCAPHTFLFLEGLKAALTAGERPHDGSKHVSAQGLRAMARVLAGWAFSQTFYREHLYRTRLGYASLEAFLTEFWEASFLAWDPDDILAMIWTGQNADVSANERFGGSVERALGSITARAYVMPGETDLYFPVEDAASEVSLMPNAHLIPIPSIWGHFAGGRGINPDDVAFIDSRLKELLET